MARTVIQAKTRDYAERNWLLVITLLTAVLGPLPVHRRRAVAAVEQAWQQIGEVTLAETY